MHAEAGHTSSQRLLELPSLKESCGKLVAREPEVDTTAHIAIT